jgi:CRISPR-associated protein Cas2
MLEIGPGVYTAPRMARGVRDRVWAVLEEWFTEVGSGSIVMTWNDPALPGGQRVMVLGAPPCDLIRYDGIYLAQKRVPPENSSGGDQGL